MRGVANQLPTSLDTRGVGHKLERIRFHGLRNECSGELRRELFARVQAPGKLTVLLDRLNRETQPARTYDELRWLIALLKSGGRLASRLDPGGTFHVSAQVRIDPLFHAHGVISAALAKPARLHELTATSGASMEQVFDVVNAYDAIGRLSWTPRQRLAAEPPTETKPAAGGRFWPFGKR